MRNQHHLSTIIITILIAFVLTLMPMPATVAWYRPIWILMALMYWAMMEPDVINIGAAWMLGICADVMNGTLLGEHALAYSVVTYFVVRSYLQLRMYSLIQQSIFVFFFSLTYLFILFCSQGITETFPRGLAYWSPALTSMLLWPGIVFIMRDSSRLLKRRWNP